MADWPEGIDMEALLAPIAGDAPTGVDLREDFTPQSPYYRLRDARAEARAAERAADANPAEEAVLPAQWRTVRELAVGALKEKAKDLEVAAWLTEALVRMEGLRGLAAGAHLIGGLVAFWDDNLYPMPDEDGIVTRVAPVTGLNGEGGGGTLEQPLRKLPLFRRPDGSAMPLWQYEQSEALAAEGDAARVKQRLAAGVLPLDNVESEARAAGAAHFARMRSDARAALAAWNAMGEAFDARAGMDGPPVSSIREVLEKIVKVVSRYAPEDIPEAEPVEEAAGEDGQVAEAGAPGAAVTRAAPVVTRDDMLRDLTRIADWFRRTEPNSPLAYTLEEAVRRGRMSWPELLQEVVKDAGVRQNILVQLGIKPAPDA